MKRYFMMTSVMLLSILCAGGCKRTPELILGETVELTTETIGPDGGTIVVEKPGDPLDGCTILVPEGAYEDTKTFKISYKPITRHTYGDDFNPVSPLISIDNGGEASQQLMVVKIPVSVPEDHAAMSFRYNAETGELDGVHTVSREPKMLTVATHHFSDHVAAHVDAYSKNQSTKSGDSISCSSAYNDYTLLSNEYYHDKAPYIRLYLRTAEE